MALGLWFRSQAARGKRGLAAKINGGSTPLGGARGRCRGLALLIPRPAHPRHVRDLPGPEPRLWPVLVDDFSRHEVVLANRPKHEGLRGARVPVDVGEALGRLQRVRVARRAPEEGLVDLGELHDAIIEAALCDRPGLGVQAPLVHEARVEELVEGRAEGVAAPSRHHHLARRRVLVSVSSVEHVSGGDVEPLDLVGALLHEAHPRAVLGVVPHGELAGNQVLVLEDEGQVQQHGVLLGDAIVVHHGGPPRVKSRGVRHLPLGAHNAVRHVRLLLHVVPEREHLPCRRVHLGVRGEGVRELPAIVERRVHRLHAPWAHRQLGGQPRLHQREQMPGVVDQGRVGCVLELRARADEVLDDAPQHLEAVAAQNPPIDAPVGLVLPLEAKAPHPPVEVSFPSVRRKHGAVDHTIPVKEVVRLFVWGAVSLNMQYIDRPSLAAGFNVTTVGYRFGRCLSHTGGGVPASFAALRRDIVACGNRTWEARVGPVPQVRSWGEVLGHCAFHEHGVALGLVCPQHEGVPGA
mmetsp:Transcript_45965/g.146740  ORF Transcript_45965/g.146740 Transcript_45965/m.146740 type:complete len:521 (-) Transcript_45965:1892-3454(-)